MANALVNIRFIVEVRLWFKMASCTAWTPENGSVATGIVSTKHAMLKLTQWMSFLPKISDEHNYPRDDSSSVAADIMSGVPSRSEGQRSRCLLSITICWQKHDRSNGTISPKRLWLIYPHSTKPNPVYIDSVLRLDQSCQRQGRMSTWKGSGQSRWQGSHS